MTSLLGVVTGSTNTLQTTHRWNTLFQPGVLYDVRQIKILTNINVFMHLCLFILHFTTHCTIHSAQMKDMSGLWRQILLFPRLWEHILENLSSLCHVISWHVVLQIVYSSKVWNLVLRFGSFGQMSQCSCFLCNWKEFEQISKQYESVEYEHCNYTFIVGYPFLRLLHSCIPFKSPFVMFLDQVIRGELWRAIYPPYIMKQHPQLE